VKWITRIAASAFGVLIVWGLYDLFNHPTDTMPWQLSAVFNIAVLGFVIVMLEMIHFFDMFIALFDFIKKARRHR
jgi:hypothetical protein